jgi:hypothetical protein
MLYVWEPVLIVGLVPIIVVEAAILKRAGGSWARSFAASGIGNTASSIVGVPLTWFALVLIQMAAGGGTAHGANAYAVTVQAPWLIPYESDLHWMVPTAALVLCVPFLAASVLVEWPIVVLLFRRSASRRVLMAVLAANGASYTGLAAFWLFTLVANWR